MYDETTKFDIYLVYTHAKDEDISNLAQHPGVSEVSATREMEQVPVSGASTPISNVYGIQSDSLFDFLKFDFRENRDEAVRRMNDERGIILASRMAETLGVKEGDRLTLTIGTTPTEYTVCVTPLGEYKVKEKLYELETSLPEDRFIRVSRSFIVNIENVSQIVPWFGRRLVLRFGNTKLEVEVSKNYSTAFKDFLGL